MQADADASGRWVGGYRKPLLTKTSLRSWWTWLLHRVRRVQGLGVSVVSGATIQLELKAGVLASPPTDGFPISRRIDVVLQRNRRPMPTTVAFLEILLGPKPAASIARAAAALVSHENHESG